MSKGTDEPSESANNHPTELHFEEIESVEIETGDITEPDHLQQTPGNNDTSDQDDNDAIHETGSIEPTSSTSDIRRAKANHRWMMRAFFAGILVVIYLLLYWQHATR